MSLAARRTGEQPARTVRAYRVSFSVPRIDSDAAGGLSVENPSAEKSGGVTVASGASGSSIRMSDSSQHDMGKTPPLAGESPSPVAHRAAPSPAASLSETHAAIKAEADKSGTNLDTWMGRLVIEQGFATLG
jgi:hypothetical protein